MSQSSAQRILTVPRSNSRNVPHRPLLRSVKRSPAPRVETWHVLAVVLVVGLSALSMAFARSKAPAVEAPVTWVQLPSVSVAAEAAGAKASAPVAVAAPEAAAHGAEVSPSRPAPAKARAGASVFDDPDAREDLTVGHALAKDAKPADRVTMEEFKLALAAQDGAANHGSR